MDEYAAGTGERHSALSMSKNAGCGYRSPPEDLARAGWGGLALGLDSDRPASRRAYGHPRVGGGCGPRQDGVRRVRTGNRSTAPSSAQTSPGSSRGEWSRVADMHGEGYSGGYFTDGITLAAPWQ